MANSKINTLKVRNSAGTVVAYDIDAKTLNGKSNYVDIDTTQTITGDKTTTGVLKIQNGSPSGAFVLGADCQYKTLTANFRKLGRMGVPSYDSTTKTVAGISFDSQASTNYADFGGHPLNSSSIAPDVIRFTVADAHNNTVNGARTLALQISKQSNLADSVSSAVPKSFAGAEFFVPVKVGGNLSATSITENGTALADKYVAQVSGKGLSTNDYTTAEKTNLGKAVLTDGAQTITGAKTFNANAVIGNGKTLWFAKTGGTSQSGAANIKWDTAGNNAPYIGYATDQTDGTFMLGSLKGTNYQSGLAIGGGSGNLLWKGSKVITISDTATTSTAGAMSASDKSKLDGIATGANNYSLPTATSSTLGGVKTGSNITNSSGTISLTSTNVTNALGYTPASPTDLANKADVYKLSKKLSEIKVGDNLSGVTLTFTGTPVKSTGNFEIVFGNQSNIGIISYGSGSGIVYGLYNGKFLGIPSVSQSFISTVGYISSYTFPTTTDNAWVVTSIVGDLTTDTNFNNTLVGTGDAVDCEYNYNEIQALKEQVNNSSSGGLYLHTLEIDTGNPYYLNLDVYTSSADPLTHNMGILYNILGTKPHTVTYNGSDGIGAVYMTMSGESTISIQGAICSPGNYMDMGTINISSATISNVTDIVKQV